MQRAKDSAAMAQAAKPDALTSCLQRAFAAVMSNNVRGQDPATFDSYRLAVRAAGLQYPWVSDPAYAEAAAAFVAQPQQQQQQQQQEVPRPFLDPGVYYEYEHAHDRCYPEHRGIMHATVQSLQELRDRPNDPRVLRCLEALREAAWMVLEDRGFEALRHALPELSEVASLVAPQIVAELASDVVENPPQKKARTQTGNTLLDSLSPQHRVVLLADTVLGLTVPGHPLPPSTPEHAAMLSVLISGLTGPLAEECFCSEQANMLTSCLADWARGGGRGQGPTSGRQMGDDVTLAEFPGWLQAALLPAPHEVLEVWLQELQRASAEAAGPGGGGGACSRRGAVGKGPGAHLALGDIRDHVRWLWACRFLEQLEGSREEDAAAAGTAAASGSGRRTLSAGGSSGGGGGTVAVAVAARRRGVEACSTLLLGVAESLMAVARHESSQQEAEVVHLARFLAEAVQAVAGRWDELPPAADALKDSSGPQQQQQPQQQVHAQVQAQQQDHREEEVGSDDGAVFAVLSVAAMRTARRAAVQQAVVNYSSATDASSRGGGGDAGGVEAASGPEADPDPDGVKRDSLLHRCGSALETESFGIVLRALCLRFVLSARRRGGPAWEDLVPSQLLLLTSHVAECQDAVDLGTILGLGRERGEAASLQLGGGESGEGARRREGAPEGNGALQSDVLQLGRLVARSVSTQLLEFAALLRQLEVEAEAYNRRAAGAAGSPAPAGLPGPAPPPACVSLLRGAPPGALSDPLVTRCAPKRSAAPDKGCGSAAGAVLAALLRQSLLAASVRSSSGEGAEGTALGGSEQVAAMAAAGQLITDPIGRRFGAYQDWLLRRAAGIFAAGVAARMRQQLIGSFQPALDDAYKSKLLALEDQSLIERAWDTAAELGSDGCSREEEVAWSVLRDHHPGSVAVAYDALRRERRQLRRGPPGAPDEQTAALSVAEGARAAPPCPFCERERQAEEGRRRNNGGGGGADWSKDGGDGTGGDGAGAPTSPFMVRRLIWRLLGKLRPSAQAWWERNAGMCPHSSDVGAWHLVLEGLRRHAAPLQQPPALRRLAQAETAAGDQKLARAYACVLEEAFQQSCFEHLPPAAAHIALAAAASPSSLERSELQGNTRVCCHLGPAAAAPCLSSDLAHGLGFLSCLPRRGAPGGHGGDYLIQLAIRALRPGLWPPRFSGLYHAALLGAVPGARGGEDGDDAGDRSSSDGGGGGGGGGGGDGGGGGGSAWRLAGELYGPGPEAAGRRARAAAVTAAWSRARCQSAEASQTGCLVTHGFSGRPNHHLDQLLLQCKSACWACGDCLPPGGGARCAGCGGVAWFCGKARCQQARAGREHASECALLQVARAPSLNRSSMLKEAEDSLAGGTGRLLQLVGLHHGYSLLNLP